MRLVAPIGIFSSDEDAAARRKELAERLKRGESVIVSPSGQVMNPEDPDVPTGKSLVAPEGKLAF